MTANKSETGSPFSQATTWNLVAPGYATNNVDHFEHYAREALAIAGVGPTDRIVDVATGPGSLALLAGPQVAKVDALDFSSEMLKQLRCRAENMAVDNVATHHGDGQDFPFADSTFDAGFSMFGLMFFPDRAAGFAELYRVLKPGGRCVVSSWQPMDNIEIFGAVFEALFAEMPQLPREEPEIPLGDPQTITAEMEAAGFKVTIHEVAHALQTPTMEDFWSGLRKAFAPVVLIENQVGTKAFESVSAAVARRLCERYGNGPVSITMSAWLAAGSRAE